MTGTGNTSSQRRDPLPDDAPHVLLVDDDQRIRDLLGRYLLENGFRVTTAHDCNTARASMRGLSFDLVILDVMMQGENGLELARNLKSISPVPICMLTAKAEPEDRVEGLEAGVDDYVTKPFEPRELVLRLQNIMRRGRIEAGPPIARHELASDDSTGSERAIDVQINRLRRKIETDPSNPIYLQTVRGKGYILYID